MHQTSPITYVKRSMSQDDHVPAVAPFLTPSTSRSSCPRMSKGRSIGLCLLMIVSSVSAGKRITELFPEYKDLPDVTEPATTWTIPQHDGPDHLGL